MEHTNANPTTERNYGIDLLRIISMFMVVLLHILGQGGILGATQALTLKGESFWTLEILCYGAVNIFAIISGYVGFKSKHTYHSIITLSLQTMFYALLVTLGSTVVTLTTQAEWNWVDTLSNLFPSARSLWFFSAYFCLFFFMPLLDQMIEHTPQKILKVAGMVAFIIFCCWTRLFTRVGSLADGYSVLWLATLYAVGAYMRKYAPLKHLSARQAIVRYFICMAVTVFSRIIIGFFSRAWLGTITGNNTLVSYLSPTIVLGAVYLVHAFSKITVKGKAQKAVAFITPLVFGVYLFHCHPYCFAHLANACVWIAKLPLLLGVPMALVAAFLLFVSCLLLDLLRQMLFKAWNAKACAVRIEQSITKLFERNENKDKPI